MSRCSKFIRLGTVSHFNYRPSRVVPHCDFNILSLMTNDTEFLFISLKFSSVQSLSRVWLFVTPWTAAHTPGSSVRLLKLMCMRQRCRPPISPSVIPFSCLQSCPASGSFSVSQFFASGGQIIGASASVFAMNIQG